MDDLISRQAALDALADYIHNVDRVYSTGKLTHDDCMDAAHSVLDKLPSAQPTDEDIQRMQDIEQAALEKAYECGKQDAQRWIPCEERLPGDDEEVIVSCTDDSGDYSLDYTTVGWHYKGLWVVNNERSYFVRAWMPPPEPWKGGEK